MAVSGHADTPTTGRSVTAASATPYTTPVPSGASGLVGPGGLREPPASWLSARRSNHVSYEPAEDGGHDPQRVSARPLSRRWPRPWRLRLPRVDGGGPGPRQIRLPGAASSRAESGAIEAHAFRRALASNEARYARPVHSPRCYVRREGVEPSRPLGHAGLGRARLPGFATSAWSGRRGSNPRILRHGEPTLGRSELRPLGASWRDRTACLSRTEEAL